MRHRSRCNQCRRPHPVFAGPQPSSQRAEGEHRQCEGDRKREFSRHRRLQVATVDRETFVEQKGEASKGKQFRNWKREFCETAESPTCGRQRQQADHTDDL